GAALAGDANGGRPPGDRDGEGSSRHSRPMASNTWRRDARHAGITAATAPATRETTARTAMRPTGMEKRKRSSGSSADANTHAHTTPSARPTEPPMAAMITDSHRTDRRS